MLRATFSPFFSTIPTKSINPTVSFSLYSNILANPNPNSNSPPVCGNVSTKNNPIILSIPPPPTSAYIHLPFCRKRCHYCDFPIVALGSSSPQNPLDPDPRFSNYITLLCQEILSTKPKSPIDPPLKTVFFGGGTPSLVPPSLISTILETLRSKFSLRSDAEISMEMDPGTFDERKMGELRELGVNRVSLGVQAFQEEMLRGCGRAHGVEEVFEAIEIVRSCGTHNWSIDLISSLPHQTVEMWQESLKLAVMAGPTHVSVYDLQVEQGTKFGLWYKPGEFPLPSETQSAMFYRIASAMLADAGYNHYEISSYCKKGYECEHNLAYWQNKSFYGFGLGSASYTGGVRFSRPKRMKEYVNYVQGLKDGLVDDHQEHCKDAKDLAMDVVMLSLRMARGLDVSYFGRAFGEDIVLSLCKAFKPYVESGHVVALDEKRRPLDADEFESLISEGGKNERIAFIRLSDPDGFLLSNELISIAFGVISP
ncbi:radical SAM superfamily protein [Tasmannia lanceolata]|uniref:radical SAM superfamily protein n=1 Tax=Tasmannia lanceolata TaxID=3420 RepID=UPI0040643910